MATNSRKADGKYASKLEERVAKQLEEKGVKYEYEPIKLIWRDRFPRAKCSECGGTEVYQQRSYTPDFVLGNGIIVEVKGRLTRRDRRILIGVVRCNSEIDLRIIFDKDNRINKGARSRYSDWARRNNFKWSIKGEVPTEWLKQEKEYPAD